MNVFHRLIKLLVISLSIFLFSILLFINPADAKNLTGGFGAGTKIATPKGDIPVEKLKVGDRIIGYNFETHHTEENIVKEIKQKSILSYYLINHKTKVAGTSLVYAKTVTKPQILRLHQLKAKQKLFTFKQPSIIINTVEQIIKPLDIYQIILNNREGNLYANNLLIHLGNKVPAYFKGQPINCQPGTPYFKQCPNINSIPGLLAAIITLLCIPLLGKSIANSIVYIKNSIRFGGREFTNDIELINFTRSINPNFTNHYSWKYYEGNKIWYQIPLQTEIEEQKYLALLKKTVLDEQVKEIYVKYHEDLVNKNFASINKYFLKFIFDKNYRNYYKYFADNFDIIYQPKINELAIVSFNDDNTFTVQINAEMINFVVSESGYVLTGNSQTKKYSEYWDIELTTDNKCNIKDINQTLATKILQGNLQAKRDLVT